jgi:hypothetical protein
MATATSPQEVRRNCGRSIASRSSSATKRLLCWIASAVLTQLTFVTMHFEACISLSGALRCCTLFAWNIMLTFLSTMQPGEARTCDTATYTRVEVRPVAFGSQHGMYRFGVLLEQQTH